jgi:RNA polymerase sigma factor (TIGR02999 family)
MVDQGAIDWQSRAHFLGMAAHLMRQLLVNYAEARGAAKHGGGLRRVTLGNAERIVLEKGPDLAALEDALKILEALDSDQCRIVELRSFGGLTIEEIAEITGVSPATVKREWSTARAWLRRELQRTGSE